MHTPAGSCSEKRKERRLASLRLVKTDEPIAEEIEVLPQDALDKSLVCTQSMPACDRQGPSSLTQKLSLASREAGTALTKPELIQTPPQKHHDLLRVALNSSACFHLSPLPSFTIHQADESLNLDVNYVAKRQGLLSFPDIEERFSLAVEKLVSKITDVEQHEPFWEYIRKLNLAGKDILTLHTLDEFCPRIEELNVSNNELGQINGAPPSLRILSVRQNCLSSLTAWGHLQNLQYLDVSENHIQNLKAFSPLVHLRELVAEGNQIESLEGVLELSGLLNLKLARNSMQRLRLDGSDLFVPNTSAL